MLRIIIALMGLVFWQFILPAQNAPFDNYLQNVENNHPALKAFRSRMEAEMLGYKAENSLPDFQLLGYYLPFGVHSGPDYWEYEFSQNFEFPGTYAARSNWIDQNQARLESSYAEMRQNILLEAKKKALQFIYLRKQAKQTAERTAQIRSLYQLNADSASSLDKQKARLIWLETQFAIEDKNRQVNELERELKALNGGEELNFKNDDYPDGVALPQYDSLWQRRKRTDPRLQRLEAESELARKNLILTRRQTLPEIGIGWNYQGFPQDHYSGFYAGLSIPLWRRGKEINIAKAEVSITEQEQNLAILRMRAEFLKRLSKYRRLTEKLAAYRETLEQLNAGSELSQALGRGEINFAEYHGEISFFQEDRKSVV